MDRDLKGSPTRPDHLAEHVSLNLVLPFSKLQNAWASNDAFRSNRSIIKAHQSHCNPHALPNSEPGAGFLLFRKAASASRLSSGLLLLFVSSLRRVRRLERVVQESAKPIVRRDWLLQAQESNPHAEQALASRTANLELSA
mmetsp:Transcript_32471/g.58279  ORF Transcript_32471/g.58279 Transcript_32471/m.58279 type:complete len:141 (-) Transcript_32471:1352-1774(-)